jgi:hypothetical protein
MELVSEYNRFSAVSAVQTAEKVGERPVEELFSDFYSQRNHEVQPDEAEQAILRFTGEQVRQGDWDDKNTPAPKTVDALLDFVLGQEAAK